MCNIQSKRKENYKYWYAHFVTNTCTSTVLEWSECLFLQVVNGISEFNSNKELEKVAIVVLNSELKPLEKFVLEIHKPDISQNQVKHNKRGNCTFYTFISNLAKSWPKQS